MVDPDLLDLGESEIRKVLEVCHRQGLPYLEVWRLYLKMLPELFEQVMVEFRMKGED